VLEFISYEGSFTATDGIAVTSVSTNIGVSQTGTEGVGTSALGCVGSGGVRTDFTWAKIPGSHSKGVVNGGQNFVNAVPAAQGMAIDDLAVTFLSGADRDGDGSPDADERVFGTDPLDATSRFVVNLTQPSAETVRLDFLTVTGRSYQVETSLNLSDWVVLTTTAGSGALVAADFPIVSSEPRRFYRLRVTMP
jgi:hypothetical protein